MPLLGPLAAALFAVVVIRSANWAATRVLWLCAALLLLGALGLALWHRRKLAELRDLEIGTMGGWRRVNQFTTWPRACRACGLVAHDWRSIRTHGDPESSACAAFRARKEAAETAPETAWTADVVTSQDGAGAIDTLTEERPPALEGDPHA